MSEKAKSGSLPSSWEDMLGEAKASQVPSETRAQVEGALAVEDAKRPTIDKAEIIERLNLQDQYNEEIENVNCYYDEIRDVREGSTKPPSFEMAMSALIPEQLEIASSYRKPTLLLIPNNSFNSKVKAMNEHKYGYHQDDVWVDKIYAKSDSESDKITGWSVAIVESRDEMDTYQGDSLNLTLKNRIENRKAARRPGEKGMNRDTYIALLMNAIRKNKLLIDVSSFTILDDDSALSDGNVPFAGFDFGHARPDFLKCSSNGPDDLAFFRSAVRTEELRLAA